MPLQEFWDKLNSHDWFYMMSDDQKVYNRGHLNWMELTDIAMEGTEEHRDLFVAFKKHKNSGKLYNTEKSPKPLRPGGPKVIEKSDIPF